MRSGGRKCKNYHYFKQMMKRVYISCIVCSLKGIVILVNLLLIKYSESVGRKNFLQMGGIWERGQVGGEDQMGVLGLRPENLEDTMGKNEELTQAN